MAQSSEHVSFAKYGVKHPFPCLGCGRKLKRTEYRLWFSSLPRKGCWGECCWIQAAQP